MRIVFSLRAYLYFLMFLERTCIVWLENNFFFKCPVQYGPQGLIQPAPAHCLCPPAWDSRPGLCFSCLASPPLIWTENLYFGIRGMWTCLSNPSGSGAEARLWLYNMFHFKKQNIQLPGWTKHHLPRRQKECPIAVSGQEELSEKLWKGWNCCGVFFFLVLSLFYVSFT